MNRRPTSNTGNNNASNPAQGNDISRPRQRKRGGGAKNPGPGSREATVIANAERPKPIQQVQLEPVSRRAPPAVLKRYGIVFYENHAQAREDSANLLLKKAELDQLNIVIRAEGSMEDAELLKFGKIYAGEAWHLIHTRRVDDGWYKEPHE